MNIAHKPLYRTENGNAYVGDALKLLEEIPNSSIDLVITSPPFALSRQKKYGNVEEHEYVDWIKPFGKQIFRVIKETGSFVLDLGGAYKTGQPSRSLYNFRVMLTFCDEIGFHLAEDFYWFNPAKLPSPIEWVNKRKIRVKDSVNTVWWFSKNAFPKADVKKVLVPYSKRMEKLIENPESFFKPLKRPSGHDISISFGKDNGGAIPSNLLSISNTDSNSCYFRLSKQLGLDRHPARFPEELPAFFIKMLTDEGETVLDIFAGSNTTGFAAESLKRKWLAFEINHEYLKSSILRFVEEENIQTITKIIKDLDDVNADYILKNKQGNFDNLIQLSSKKENTHQLALIRENNKKFRVGTKQGRNQT
jgi:DNA modification methylase